MDEFLCEKRLAANQHCVSGAVEEVRGRGKKHQIGPSHNLAAYENTKRRLRCFTRASKVQKKRERQPAIAGYTWKSPNLTSSQDYKNEETFSMFLL